MYKPLVSIQIPTYNQKEYIKDALESALAQTYDNLQIIVSDDCSPDYDIFEHLKEYADNPKVLIHRNKKNLGRVGNYRNTLYNLVKGEWFVNLDGDDYFIDNNFIAEAVKYLESAIAAFQAGVNTDALENAKVPSVKFGEKIYRIAGEQYLLNIDKGLGFSHASILFNVAKAKKANFYNLNILNSDYMSFAKILSMGDFILYGKEVYSWRIHKNQATWTSSIKEIVAKYKAVDDLISFYGNKSTVGQKNMIKRLYIFLDNELFNKFLVSKHPIKNFKVLKKYTKFRLSYFRAIISLLKNNPHKLFSEE